MASLSPLQGALGTRRAAHLLRRTSFRYNKSKVDQMAGQTAAQALTSLLQAYNQYLQQPIYDDVATVGVNENETWILPLPGTNQTTNEFKYRRFVLSWWSDEAMRDPGIVHKMVIFWHQYMTVSNQSSGSRQFFDYLSLLRWAALGNFKKLATKIVLDNVMLVYLNNQQNTKTSPNENFAREYLELFTIGKGPQVGPGDYTNYTEDDIIQAAKLLTGFRTKTDRSLIDPETGIPRGFVDFTKHSTDPKQFSSRFQNTTTLIPGAANVAGMFTELDAFVKMIFDQPETAKNLCRRLYRFFVSKNITAEIETDIIVPLSNTLINAGFEVKPVLQQLLQSQHFFDEDDSDNKDEIVGGMIKSPLELSYHALSFFNLVPPDPATQPLNNYNFHERGLAQRMMGLANYSPFNPSDVAGYPGFYQDPDYSRAWFNSSTIIARYKVPAMLLSGKLTIGGSVNTALGVKLDIAPWVKNSGVISDPEDSYVLVQDLLTYMLPETIDNDRFTYFLVTVFLDQLPPADWTYEWQNYLATNNDGEVKIALERLINAIMYSPEYQTF
jgi:uncharacterized protein (DUF1800 family)